MDIMWPSLLPSIPPYAPVVISTLLHHIRLPGSRNKDGNAFRNIMYQHAIPALILFALPPHSVTSLLRLLTCLTCQWPWLLNLKKRQRHSPSLSPTQINSKEKNEVVEELFPLLQFLVAGGPFGFGCGKILELIGAYFLLSIRYHDDNNEMNSNKKFPFLSPPSDAFHWGPIPSLKSLCAVTFLSVVVNVVLAIWSRIQKSRGDHRGVNSMLDNSVGHCLTVREHLCLSCLAFGNALCEEGVSRGFFHYELMKSGGFSREKANVLQALSFGIGHYHGIPSGWTGVSLTFVYGWIMGELMEYGEGLCLPVLAHTVADYFIFAVIARKAVDAKKA